MTGVPCCEFPSASCILIVKRGCASPFEPISAKQSFAEIIDEALTELETLELLLLFPRKEKH